MAKPLVIVESPAKAKTLSRFLGNKYRVEASFGHIRDLPERASEVPESIKDKSWGRMAVDVDGDFTPHYVIPTDKKKHIAQLKAALKEASEVFLATDPDREGESISWHLKEVLKPKVPVKKSVMPDHIVCLEDGKKFKSLKRHLRTHYNLSPEEYREKWGLPHDYPMVAPNYARARSDLAKKMGLGTRREK